MIFTDDTIEIIDLYLKYVRPRLNPQCDFLLISTKGTQFQSLTPAMTILVHEAIGKHINPTRYRQIIETESSERLNLEEQHFISEDQKHSSTVAKIHYKKTQSRIVAIEGKKCMEKMTKNARTDGNQNLVEMFNRVSCSFDNNVLRQSQRIIEGGEFSESGIGSSRNQAHSQIEIDQDLYQPISESLNESIDLTMTESAPMDCTKVLTTRARMDDIPNDDIEIKREVAQQQVTKRNVKFTSEEDQFLKQGITKYGRKSWSVILKDPTFSFHSSRTKDSLRVRANSACFKKLIVDED